MISVELAGAAFEKGYIEDIFNDDEEYPEIEDKEKAILERFATLTKIEAELEEVVAFFKHDAGKDNDPLTKTGFELIPKAFVEHGVVDYNAKYGVVDSHVDYNARLQLEYNNGKLRSALEILGNHGTAWEDYMDETVNSYHDPFYYGDVVTLAAHDLIRGIETAAGGEEIAFADKIIEGRMMDFVDAKLVEEDYDMDGPEKDGMKKELSHRFANADIHHKKSQRYYLSAMRYYQSKMMMHYVDTEIEQGYSNPTLFDWLNMNEYTEFSQVEEAIRRDLGMNADWAIREYWELRRRMWALNDMFEERDDFGNKNESTEKYRTTTNWNAVKLYLNTEVLDSCYMMTSSETEEVLKNHWESWKANADSKWEQMSWSEKMDYQLERMLWSDVLFATAATILVPICILGVSIFGFPLFLMTVMLYNPLAYGFYYLIWHTATVVTALACGGYLAIRIAEEIDYFYTEIYAPDGSAVPRSNATYFSPMISHQFILRFLTGAVDKKI